MNHPANTKAPKARLAPLLFDANSDVKEPFNSYEKSPGFVPDCALILLRKPNRNLVRLGQLAGAVWYPQGKVPASNC